MFVHNSVQRDVNITAEVSETEAEQLQEMCQNFAKKLN